MLKCCSVVVFEFCCSVLSLVSSVEWGKSRWSVGEHKDGLAIVRQSGGGGAADIHTVAAGTDYCQGMSTAENCCGGRAVMLASSQLCITDMAIAQLRDAMVSGLCCTAASSQLQITITTIA